MCVAIVVIEKIRDIIPVPAIVRRHKQIDESIVVVVAPRRGRATRRCC